MFQGELALKEPEGFSPILLSHLNKAGLMLPLTFLYNYVGDLRAKACSPTTNRATAITHYALFFAAAKNRRREKTKLLFRNFIRCSRRQRIADEEGELIKLLRGVAFYLERVSAVALKGNFLPF